MHDRQNMVQKAQVSICSESLHYCSKKNYHNLYYHKSSFVIIYKRGYSIVVTFLAMCFFTRYPPITAPEITTTPPPAAPAIIGTGRDDAEEGLFKVGLDVWKKTKKKKQFNPLSLPKYFHVTLR